MLQKYEKNDSLVLSWLRGKLKQRLTFFGEKAVALRSGASIPHSRGIFSESSKNRELAGDIVNAASPPFGNRLCQNCALFFLAVLVLPVIVIIGELC